ncbi:MAG: class I SAM-dependent methyltransferase [Deltaproteobacteria bacterium]|nr:class I SAM-dependent methyltransferase [Deltaproteobacteria bacterium]
METRKEKEIAFHNQRERDRQVLDEEAFRKKYSNKKWYSITRRSSEYLSDWLNRNCPGRTALDYCCGLGGVSLQMARCGAFVHGIDISAESVQTAERLLSDCGYGNTSSFRVMDAENLEFESNTFDIIVCSGVLHHLDIKLAYPQLARVLKPEGKILCMEALGYNPVITLYRKWTPHLRTDWEADHILTLREVNLARSCFGAVDVSYFHLFSILGVAFRGTSFFNGALSILDRMDDVILKVPGIRLMAWQMIFELSKPVK